MILKSLLNRIFYGGSKMRQAATMRISILLSIFLLVSCASSNHSPKIRKPSSDDTITEKDMVITSKDKVGKVLEIRGEKALVQYEGWFNFSELVKESQECIRNICKGSEVTDSKDTNMKVEYLFSDGRAYLSINHNSFKHGNVSHLARKCMCLDRLCEGQLIEAVSGKVRILEIYENGIVEYYTPEQFQNFYYPKKGNLNTLGIKIEKNSLCKEE